MVEIKDVGFNAIGKPIPDCRRQNAFDLCKEWGINTETAMLAVGEISNHLERDEPYKAMEKAKKYVDITGAYRLFAVLLAS